MKRDNLSLCTASHLVHAGQNARSRRTSKQVRIKILISKPSDQLLIYTRSNVARSVISSSNRVSPRNPLTCAQPISASRDHGATGGTIPTAKGIFPTGTVATTKLVAVRITETLADFRFAT